MSVQLHEFRIPFAGVKRTVIYHFSDLHLAVADETSTPDEVTATQKAVSEFDVEGMNEAIDDLRSAVDDLDIEALNEAIDSLNTTIQPLKNFVEMFGGKK